MTEFLVSLHAVVHGRVQGVFFRASARERAGSLGLGGWVRNLPEGTVEVYAVGSRPRLEELRDWLRRGPGGARVERVEEDWGEADSQPNRFDITTA